mmetsp:Transcript_26806/g.33395  ORF Transcript_26806/g.33395 Transcript_26806/m.33395 type:complete len:108 (-) Transcript_26806:407-730(-)
MLSHEAYEANLHCFECLIVKTPQMYHCKKCGSCIDMQHKHSEFLGKCIGRDNAIAYFWFLASSLVLNLLIVACLCGCISGDTDGDDSGQEPSTWGLRLVESVVLAYE